MSASEKPKVLKRRGNERERQRERKKGGIVEAVGEREREGGGEGGSDV